MEFIQLVSNISVLSIVLFLLGIGLIIVELHSPGFGAAGIAGLLCLIICIFVTVQSVTQGIILTGIFFVLLVIIFVIFFVLLSKGRVPKKLILEESTSAELGFSGTEDMSFLLGKTGTVTSICRPAGNADIEGLKLDVVSRGEFIEKGAIVEVVEVEGSRIVVKEKTENEKEI